MKKILGSLLLVTSIASGQVIGKTVTEDYQAGFEGKESIYTLPEYNGKPVPVALLDIGVSKEVIEQLADELLSNVVYEKN